MGKKVLVVDDEKLIVKGLRFSLEQEGMEVDCAYDGEEEMCIRDRSYSSFRGEDRGSREQGAGGDPE